MYVDDAQTTKAPFPKRLLQTMEILASTAVEYNLFQRPVWPGLVEFATTNTNLSKIGYLIGYIEIIDPQRCQRLLKILQSPNLHIDSIIITEHKITNDKRGNERMPFGTFLTLHFTQKAAQQLIAENK